MVGRIREYVQGFDARRSAGAWSTDRRELFLLRTDVVTPYSTDVDVWASVVFDPMAPRPAYCAGLEELFGVLGARASDEEPTIIAITRATTPGEDYFTMVVPDHVDDAWRLLGYDVSTDTWLSGLMNTSYEGQAAAELRPHWAARLNSQHLFRDREDALRSCTVTDARVPEHAPVFAHGIYQVCARV